MDHSSCGGRGTAKMELFRPAWLGRKVASVLGFPVGPLCRCGEVGPEFGRVPKGFTYLLLYPFYSQESTGVLEKSCHHRKSCRSHARFSWDRGFAASELSRSISPPLPSRFGNTESRGRGLGRTHLRGDRGGAYLNAAARRRMETRRCTRL